VVKLSVCFHTEICNICGMAKSTFRVGISEMSDDIFMFNGKCRSLIQMMTDATPLTEILMIAHIFLDYIRKLPSRIYECILDGAKIQNSMITARMQLKPYSLLDDMEAAKNTG
jgi:hypothetical protein